MFICINTPDLKEGEDAVVLAASQAAIDVIEASIADPLRKAVVLAHCKSEIANKSEEIQKQLQIGSSRFPRFF